MFTPLPPYPGPASHAGLDAVLLRHAGPDDLALPLATPGRPVVECGRRKGVKIEYGTV